MQKSIDCEIILLININLILAVKLEKFERFVQQSERTAIVSFESIAKLFQPLLQCSCLGPEALVEHIGKRKKRESL